MSRSGNRFENVDLGTSNVLDRITKVHRENRNRILDEVVELLNRNDELSAASLVSQMKEE